MRGTFTASSVLAASCGKIFEAALCGAQTDKGELMAELALLLIIILTIGGFSLIYYLLKNELPRSAEPPPNVAVIDRRARQPLPPPPQGVVIIRRVVITRRRAGHHSRSRRIGPIREARLSPGGGDGVAGAGNYDMSISRLKVPTRRLKRQ
jgi:hypothetical protein